MLCTLLIGYFSLKAAAAVIQELLSAPPLHVRSVFEHKDAQGLVSNIKCYTFGTKDWMYTCTVREIKCTKIGALRKIKRRLTCTFKKSDNCMWLCVMFALAV